MSETVVVLGAGQAGLSVSRELRELDIDHVMLERSEVAQAWRSRWDSFTLVTPNWTMDLPGSPYAGDDPEGHVPRDEIVAYLDDYAQTHAGPIRTGVDVTALTTQGPLLRLQTNEGPIDAESVVVCTGAYQRSHHPAAAFPPGLLVIDSTDYRRPADLPDGRVLVIGSGQTGVQLAEELHLSGRDVVVACGRAPWVPRRLGDEDIVTWISRTAYLDAPASTLPTPAARLIANFQATGARGGHDLHYRVLQDMGVTLAGRLAGVDGDRALFEDDLAASVAFGDARYIDIRNLLNDQLGSTGVTVPEMPDPPPFHDPGVREVDLHDFGAVIFTSGFRPDYRRWIELPVFDELGFPIVGDDLSTAVPGLYFCGVHFLRTRRSSLLFGVGMDAAIVARTIQDARNQ